MEGWDENQAVGFRFNMDDPDGPWYWQREYVDWMWDNKRCITLKARQIGVTWLWAAFGVWMLLYRPGSRVLVYRQNEDEAKEVVVRMWQLYQSLPPEYRNGAEVIRPKADVPHMEIVLGFPGGEKSTLRGMTSTAGAGHGSTGALVIMDEHSRIERAAQIMKAVTAVIGQKGRLGIVSTANGRSNLETGEGNNFHFLWQNADNIGLAKRFLGWRNHPDRDDHWYQTSEETRVLKEHERMEQYPDTAEEAFAFAEAGFFDKESLLAYSRLTVDPAYRMAFVKSSSRKAVVSRTDSGPIRVWKEPYAGDGTPEDPPHSYALAADVATGRGADYSAAYVIDLTSMEFVAEIHGKLGADVYAEQLHYLGRWYNTARIAVEDAGGWGEPVIIFLRDGRDGRPPYPAFYRHRQWSRADLQQHKPFGFPMNTKTRPTVLRNLERAIREQTLPHLPEGLLMECGTFVHHETGTSPRALDGCHDDRVMAAAVAMEMYRQFGAHPDQYKSQGKRGYKPMYPWEVNREKRRLVTV